MYQELIRFFGKVGTKYFGKHLQSLRELIEKSNLPIIYETYIGQLFFYCFLSFNIFFVYFLSLFLTFWGFNSLISIVSSLILTTTLSFSLATVFYLYPFYRYKKQLEDIERNMPLGISYMNIISKSGVPPEDMFEYVSKAKEFGEFAIESERIYKHINFTGKDIISSIKEIASKTPSEKFKNFLLGFVATILSGSDINRYLDAEAKKGIYEYEGRQEKYTSIMSFFADIFIVGLIIVPLVLVIVLSVFSLIEPVFLSFEILYLLKLITYFFIPVAGIFFLFVLNRVRV